MSSDYFGNVMDILNQGMALRRQKQQQELQMRELELRERQEKQAIEAQKLQADLQAINITKSLQGMFENVPTKAPPMMPMSPLSTGTEVPGSVEPLPAPDNHAVLPLILNMLGGQQIDVPIQGAQANQAQERAARMAKEGVTADPMLMQILATALGRRGIDPSVLEGLELGDNIAPEALQLLQNTSQEPAPVNMQGQDLYGLPNEVDPRLLEAVGRKRTQDAIGMRNQARLDATLFDANDPNQVSAVDRIFFGLQRGEYTDISQAATQADKIGKGGARALYAKLAETNAIVPTSKQREKVSTYDSIIQHLTNVRNSFDEVQKLIASGEFTLDTAYSAVSMKRIIDATASMLPKAFGESGRLSDQDVERALLAMPTWFDVTVTPELGLKKLDEALALATKGQREYMDAAFSTYNMDQSGRVQRNKGPQQGYSGGELGNAVARTNQNDGVYTRGGKQYVVRDGFVYNMPEGQ